MVDGVFGVVDGVVVVEVEGVPDAALASAAPPAAMTPATATAARAMPTRFTCFTSFGAMKPVNPCVLWAM